LLPTSGTAAGAFSRIFALLKAIAAVSKLDRLADCLQTATLAHRDGRDVVCALLDLQPSSR
jgi:predicted HD phosphohydrolase